MKKILLSISLFALFFTAIAQTNCNDKIFVTVAGGGTGLAPNSPTTFTAAIGMITAGRNHVMIASGTYTISGKVSVPSNAILDGRYSTNATQWTKSSANTTTLNITPSLQTNTVSGVSTGNYIAMQLINQSNVYIKDLTIRNMASTTGRTSNRGRNMYGIYASNSSNFYFSRLDIQTNNASNGLNGNAGAGGFTGSAGVHGHDGDNDGNDKCDDGGAYGGIAGHGGAGAGGGGGGGSGAQRCDGEYGGGGGNGNARAGGGGGGGGSGEREDGAASRSGGRGGQSGNGTLGGAGGAANNADDGRNGSGGSVGANGANAATNWGAGNRPTNYTYGAYFVPGAQANSGSSGFGGAGGGGGGGGSDQSCGGCNDGSGAGGGGGGGGGNFGVYATGGANKFLYNILFSLGNAGTGGTGGTRGNRGTYGGGASGGVEDEVGNGGWGGRGGYGGYGGRGRDGANGVRANTQSVTLSGTSVPNPTTLTTTSYGGCTNSVFDYTKTSGNWSGVPFINDINASSTSYANGNNAVKVFYTTGGHKDVTVAGHTYRNFNYVGTSRNAPAITISASQICQGGTVNLSATDWGTQTQYQWEVFRGDESTDPLEWSSTSADPNGAGPFNTIGDYLVKYQAFERCCGWSIPVYETFEVVADPVSSAIAKSPNVANVCVGDNISISSPGGTGGVGCTDQYRYSTNNGTSWSSWDSALPNIPAVAGTNLIETRRNCTGSGCGTSASNQVSWIVDPTPVGGTTANDQAICFDANAINVSLSGNNANVVRWEIDDNSSFSSPAVISNTTTTLTGAEIDGEIGSSNNVTLYVQAVVDNACPEETSSYSIVRYNEPDDVVMQDATGDCNISNAGTWTHIYDPVTDRIIASVNDNGQNLGQVDATVYYHGGSPFKVWSKNTQMCPGQIHAVMNRSFVLNSANAINASIPVGVRLYFTDSELSDLIALAGCGDPNGCQDDDDICTINGLFVTQISGATNEDGTFTLGDGTFTVHSPANSGTGNNHFGANYVQFNVTQFSEFWLHGSEHQTTLPVELIEFKAKSIDNKWINLKWNTATELDNEGFDIERSIDGLNFEKVGWVEGHGTTVEMQEYEFDDANVSKGTYYYRLRQVDFDGESEYSNIVFATIYGEDNFTISPFVPNPAKDLSSIKVTALERMDIEIVLYDNIGRIIDSKEVTIEPGLQNISFDTENYPSGLYHATIKVGDATETRKLIIVK